MHSLERVSRSCKAFSIDCLKRDLRCAGSGLSALPQPPAPEPGALLSRAEYHQQQRRAPPYRTPAGPGVLCGRLRCGAVWGRHPGRHLGEGHSRGEGPSVGHYCLTPAGAYLPKMPLAGCPVSCLSMRSAAAPARATHAAACAQELLRDDSIAVAPVDDLHRTVCTPKAIG